MDSAIYSCGVLQIRSREFSSRRAAQKKEGLLSTYLLTHFIGFVGEMRQKMGVNGRGFPHFSSGDLRREEAKER